MSADSIMSAASEIVDASTGEALSVASVVQSNEQAICNRSPSSSSTLAKSDTVTSSAKSTITKIPATPMPHKFVLGASNSPNTGQFPRPSLPCAATTRSSAKRSSANNEAYVGAKRGKQHNSTYEDESSESSLDVSRESNASKRGRKPLKIAYATF